MTAQPTGPSGPRSWRPAPDTTLADYLDRAVARWPDRTAVVDGHDSSLTYRQLGQAAERVRTFLVGAGLRQGDRVALMAPKCCESIAVIFGVLAAGAAYVPIDATAAPIRVAKVRASCQPRLIFADPGSLSRLRSVDSMVDGVVDGMPHAVINPGIAGFQPSSGLALPTTAPDGEDQLACLLYTSGSTGTPKGVPITHRNAVSFVEWASATFAITEHDRLANHAPLHFDLSVLDIFAATRSGATTYLIEEALAGDARRLPDFIARQGITVWYSAPSILSRIADQAADPDPGQMAPNRLRLVLFAGEAFPVPPLRRLTRMWPQPAYYNLYGPTETNVCTFARIPTPVPDDRTTGYSIGQACAHCAVLLFDDHRQPVPNGTPGELCVAGPSVFSGYWGTDSGRDPAFFNYDGRRWYRTGDIAEVRADGIHLHGRRDRMVKRLGHRIELDEIQQALSTCPQLKEAAVVADISSASAVITAFYVAATQQSVIELRRFCRSQLGRHLIPDRFIPLPELPRTSTGKTDYQRLRQMGERR